MVSRSRLKSFKGLISLVIFVCAITLIFASETNADKEGKVHADPTQKEASAHKSSHGFEEFLDKYQRFSQGIFDFIEKIFAKLIMPLYYEIKQNIWLNMAFMMILSYSILKLVMRQLVKLFKSKPKYIYNTEEASTNNETQKVYEKLLEEFKEIKQLVESTELANNQSLDRHANENNSIDLNGVLLTIQKQQKIIDSLVKENNKVHDLLAASENDIVESLQALGKDIFTVMGSNNVKASYSNSGTPVVNKIQDMSNPTPSNAKQQVSSFSYGGPADSKNTQAPSSISRKSSVSSTSVNDSIKELQKPTTNDNNKLTTNDNKTPGTTDNKFEIVKISTSGNNTSNNSYSNSRQELEGNKPSGLDNKPLKMSKQQDINYENDITAQFEEEKTKNFASIRQSTQKDEPSGVSFSDTKPDLVKEVESTEPIQTKKLQQSQNLPPKVFQPARGIPVIKGSTIQRPGGAMTNPVVNPMNKGLQKLMPRPVINMAGTAGTTQADKGGV